VLFLARFSSSLKLSHVNQIYLIGVKLYKKNWKKVTAHVGTRISAQVRSHAQKVLKDYSPNYKPSDDEDQSDDSDDEFSSNIGELKKLECSESGRQSGRPQVKESSHSSNNVTLT
jgi:hypothetical protein